MIVPIQTIKQNKRMITHNFKEKIFSGYNHPPSPARIMTCFREIKTCYEFREYIRVLPSFEY
jgi:hypothetical protein